MNKKDIVNYMDTNNNQLYIISYPTFRTKSEMATVDPHSKKNNLNAFNYEIIGKFNLNYGMHRDEIFKQCARVIENCNRKDIDLTMPVVYNKRKHEIEVAVHIK